jgi:integrase
VNLLKYFKDTPVSRIDSKMIEDYIKTRKDKVRPRTVNIELTYLGAMFRRAIEEKYLFKENPIKSVEKLKVPKRHPRFLSVEEMQRLWDAASAWVRIFIVISTHSGMRAGEVSNLRWRDIDWGRNIIKIPITKTNRERELPMTPVLRSTLSWFRLNFIDFRRMITLERKPEQMEYVFCDLNGNKINSFRGGFRKARLKAGINDITIHTLRHTFASHLANGGTPLLTIKDLLGHTDIKTTTIYAHLSNEHLQNAVKQIDYGLNASIR